MVFWLFFSCTFLFFVSCSLCNCSWFLLFSVEYLWRVLHSGMCIFPMFVFIVWWVKPYGVSFLVGFFCTVWCVCDGCWKSTIFKGFHNLHWLFFMYETKLCYRLSFRHKLNLYLSWNVRFDLGYDLYSNKQGKSAGWVQGTQNTIINERMTVNMWNQFNINSLITWEQKERR